MDLTELWLIDHYADVPPTGHLVDHVIKPGKAYFELFQFTYNI